MTRQINILAVGTSVLKFDGTHLYVTINGVDYQLDQQSGGSAVWGGITGTLSAQTDLQDALDSKLTQAQILTRGLGA